MIYSFDIFDTLITRITGTPTGVFAIMQSTLLSDAVYNLIPRSLRENFYPARIYLEQKARDYSDAEDLTIVDIYNYISLVFGLTSDSQKKLIELEINTEIRVTVGVDENINKLKDLIMKGETVILLSDMYLRKKDIIQILDNIDPLISQSCAIYVSSELNKTKHCGTLFDHIINQFNIKPSEIIHLGDSEISDIRSAKKKNLGTIHYTGTKNNYYEKYIVNQKQSSMALQIMVGISKLARMKLADEVEVLGCSLAGPWIYTFVKWVLERAALDGIKKLYFLSRDGDLLLKAAKQIMKNEKSNIELKYLCVSRHSTVYPSIDKIDNRAIDYILQKHPYLNADMLAQRSYTSKNVLVSFFKTKYNINLDVQNLNNGVCHKIEKILKTDSELQDIILKNRDLKKDSIIKYFEQEGLFDTDTIAIVDVGWLCTIQDAIYSIVKNSIYKNTKIKGYYFGITNYSDCTHSHNQKIPFAFHPFSSNTVYNKPYYVIFMELFCSSPLDITVDYYTENGEVKVKQKPSKTNHRVWIDSLRKGILAYIDTMMCFKTFSSIDFSKDVNWYMSIYYNPDKKLADLLGKIRYSGDPFDSDLREFAPKFTIKNMLKRGISKWIEGSLRRSSFIFRIINVAISKTKNKLLEAMHRLKSLSKRVLWKFLPL